jgi:hypothetical protein
MRVLGQPPAWQDAALASQKGLYLTAQEARDLGEAMHRLLEPFQERWAEPPLRPPGSLRYEVLLLGYPLTDPPDPSHPSHPPQPSELPEPPGAAGPARPPGTPDKPETLETRD